MGRFTQGDALFADEDVLRDSYIPDQLLERQEEINEYEAALQPTVNGAQPRNIFVYGETGVGKTLATRMILGDLEEDQENFDGVDIEIVWHNCKDSTSYQTACQLVNKVRQDGGKISCSGHPRSHIHDKLWEHIDKLDATHVLFVLDEVDSFGTDDELLYQIPRASSNQKVADTEVGLIGISNDFTFREDLSARVQSSLCEQEIHFAPYDSNELRPILSQRAEHAFVDGALTDDVVPLAAAFAGQDTGSARHALDILYKAGSLARKNDADQVTEGHVRKAVDEVDRGMIEAELRELPMQNHLVLYALLALSRSGDAPARRKEIYSVYETVANRIEADAKSPRTIHNRLSQLKLKGFLRVDEKNEGIEGGKYYTYDLDLNEQIVEDVLRQDHRIGEVMENKRLSEYA